jgi:geranylgeranyl pyrophosphate synthase
LLDSLKDNFQENYFELVLFIWKIIFSTTIGQTIDFRTTKPSMNVINQYTRNKTGKHTFYLPFYVVLIAAGLSIQTDSRFNEFLESTGIYFQCQDDLIDAFRNPEPTRKEGTDLTDGKINWVVC